MPLDLQSLGRKVVELRKKRDWTQEELANQADLSSPVISFLERGRRCPSALTIVKLSTAFGISAAELLDSFIDAEHLEDSTGEDTKYIAKYKAASMKDKARLRLFAEVLLREDPESIKL